MSEAPDQIVEINPHREPFIYHVLKGIDQEVKENLSQEQLTAFVDALRRNQPLSKHPVDLRGSLPFFTKRFYFVLLMGKDRRAKLKKMPGDRRREVSSAVVFLFIASVLGVFIGLEALVLYLLTM